jgi:hypothetical protein
MRESIRGNLSRRGKFFAANSLPGLRRFSRDTRGLPDATTAAGFLLKGYTQTATFCHFFNWTLRPERRDDCVNRS